MSNSAAVDGHTSRNSALDWEHELADLLAELSAAQDDLIEVLKEKRERLAACDTEGSAALAPRHDEVAARLAACQQRRQRLLATASREGLPAGSITKLARALPASSRKAVQADLKAAENRMRLLRHHSLSTWVLAQQSLLHLSQLLEILASGGRLQPTYEEGKPSQAGGSLVDRTV